MDSIGDFLTVIRNALMVSKRSISVPFSQMKQNIAEILKQEGFVRDVKVVEEAGKQQLVVYLKYVNGEPVIHELKRISKPGCRRYESVRNITSVIGGMGISILTTNVGIITDKKAKELSVGGEVICHVW